MGSTNESKQLISIRLFALCLHVCKQKLKFSNLNYLSTNLININLNLGKKKSQKCEYGWLVVMLYIASCLTRNVALLSNSKCCIHMQTYASPLPVKGCITNAFSVTWPLWFLRFHLKVLMISFLAYCITCLLVRFTKIKIQRNRLYENTMSVIKRKVRNI